MKKVLMYLGMAAGVVAGALLLWNVVFPFIGNVFQWMADVVKGLF